jgi:cobyrinic acid a,c-diamide synthase
MTGPQAAYLKTLCAGAGYPELFDENLTKAEASKRIDELKRQLGLE